MPNDESPPSDPISPDRDEKIEATFRRLRRDGYSRQNAVQVILDVLDVSLSEAKRLLHTNDTWADALADSDRGTASPSSSVPPAPG